MAPGKAPRRSLQAPVSSPWWRDSFRVCWDSAGRFPMIRPGKAPATDIAITKVRLFAEKRPGIPWLRSHFGTCLESEYPSHPGGEWLGGAAYLASLVLVTAHTQVTHQPQGGQVGLGGVKKNSACSHVVSGNSAGKVPGYSVAAPRRRENFFAFSPLRGDHPACLRRQKPPT